MCSTEQPEVGLPATGYSVLLSHAAGGVSWVGGAANASNLGLQELAACNPPDQIWKLCLREATQGGGGERIRSAVKSAAVRDQGCLSFSSKSLDMRTA